MGHDGHAAAHVAQVVPDLRRVHVGQGDQIDISVLGHRFQDPKGGDLTSPSAG